MCNTKIPYPWKFRINSYWKRIHHSSLTLKTSTFLMKMRNVKWIIYNNDAWDDLGLIIMPCRVKWILSVYIYTIYDSILFLGGCTFIYTTFNIATNNVKYYEALFYCKKQKHKIELTSFFAVVQDQVSTLVEKYIF